MATYKYRSNDTKNGGDGELWKRKRNPIASATGLFGEGRCTKKKGRRRETKICITFVPHTTGSHRWYREGRAHRWTVISKPVSSTGRVHVRALGPI